MRALGRFRSVLAVVGVCVLLGVAGCGSDDSTSADPGADPGTGGTTQSAAPTGDTAEVPTDLCAVVTAAELSDALGVAVTTTVGPSGDCEFSGDDARGLSGSLGVVDDAEANGGFETYLAGLDASMTDPTAHDIAGLGDAAVVKTGVPLMGSGENLMAAGAVDRGSFLLQVTLVQGQGIPEDALVTAAGNALRLADAKTS